MKKSILFILFLFTTAFSQTDLMQYYYNSKPKKVVLVSSEGDILKSSEGSAFETRRVSITTSMILTPELIKNLYTSYYLNNKLFSQRI